jgi:hypothetical protein
MLWLEICVLRTRQSVKRLKTPLLASRDDAGTSENLRTRNYAKKQP